MTHQRNGERKECYERGCCPAEPPREHGGRTRHRGHSVLGRPPPERRRHAPPLVPPPLRHPPPRPRPRRSAPRQHARLRARSGPAAAAEQSPAPPTVAATARDPPDRRAAEQSPTDRRAADQRPAADGLQLGDPPEWLARLHPQ